MDTVSYILLKIFNGQNWNPEFGRSVKYKNWIAVLDIKTCLECRSRHGKIWLINEKPDKEPLLHKRCRCSIFIMQTVKSGTATIKRENGADWALKYQSELPDYYLTAAQAKEKGWIPEIANLWQVCPNQMIFGGEYKNRNGHLPSKEGRVWYEADINYQVGYRNNQRIIFSNDGLIFVTYDHYKTFFEIV